MASITKRARGQWRARVRRRGYPLQSATFDLRAEAEAWARKVEHEMDMGTFVFPKNAGLAGTGLTHQQHQTVI